MVELQEEIFGDHFIPEIGVVSGGVSAEVAEGRPCVSFRQRSEERVFAGVIQCDGVEVHVFRFGFVNVVGDGAEGILAADPAAASESGGAVHAGDQLGRDGLAGFIVAGEFREDLRAANPLFEHLRRGLDEIGFHADAGDAGPLLLAAEDVVHKVAKFVEESADVTVVHESGVGSGRCWKIADEDGFRQLLAADAIEHRRHFSVAVFAGARVHIEIKTSDGLAAVDDDPGFNGRIPGGNVFFLLKIHMEEIGSGIEDALLHFHEGKVGTDGLRIEIVLCAAN